MRDDVHATRYPTHHTQILSPELADGLLALGVRTMDDCMSKSTKELARLPGLSKKDAQRLKDHLNKLPRFAQGDLVRSLSVHDRAGRLSIATASTRAHPHVSLSRVCPCRCGPSTAGFMGTHPASNGTSGPPPKCARWTATSPATR